MGAAGPLAPLLARLGANLPLAWACFRRRKVHRVVFTDGEQVGIPYAAMTWLVRRRPRHVMIGHVLSPRKKSLLHRVLRLQHRVDARRRVRHRAGPVRRRRARVPAATRSCSPTFMVDTDFWRPDAVTPTPAPRPLLCAVGQERRDYPTLVDAVRELDVDVAIAAVSPWSKYQDSSAGLDVPANVTARGYDLFELRQLYADAAFVVVPLEETDFQAGITTILEAMAMGKAVVCTPDAPARPTSSIDGDNGIYVPPGDPDALRGGDRAPPAPTPPRPSGWAPTVGGGSSTTPTSTATWPSSPPSCAPDRAASREERRTRAGTPPTIVSSGTDSVTTAPAATTQPAPMCTPGRISARVPTQVPSPTDTACDRVPWQRCSWGPMSCVVVSTVMSWPK